MLWKTIALLSSAILAFSSSLPSPKSFTCDPNRDESLRPFDFIEINAVSPLELTDDDFKKALSGGKIRLYFGASRQAQGKASHQVALNSGSLQKPYCSIQLEKEGFSKTGRGYRLKTSSPSAEEGCLLKVTGAAPTLTTANIDPGNCSQNPSRITQIACYSNSKRAFSLNEIQNLLMLEQKPVFKLDQGCGANASAALTPKGPSNPPSAPSAPAAVKPVFTTTTIEDAEACSIDPSKTRSLTQEYRNLKKTIKELSDEMNLIRKRITPDTLESASHRELLEELDETRQKAIEKLQELQGESR